MADPGFPGEGDSNLVRRMCQLIISQFFLIENYMKMKEFRRGSGGGVELASLAPPPPSVPPM